jgi:eukaryotic-like serine/threonine-protein kinase
MDVGRVLLAIAETTSDPGATAKAQPLVAVGAPGPTAGQLLGGRYRLEALLAPGETSSVWRAHDEVLARDVAVKQLRDGHRYALAEARIAARVRHPNVAAVHDVVQETGSCWLVMDYYPGGTLAALPRGRRQLPSPVVAALGLRLLAALEALHAAGIVHCDVKPANVLLSENGHPVLTDFGIAEGSEGDPTHPARRNGDVVGSPAYLAPELVRGDAPRPSADLWSLGATLYAAVEGRPPFLRPDTMSTLAAVLHDPPAPAPHAGRLGPILAELLNKDPARRPSHDAIRAALVKAGAATSTPLAAAPRRASCSPAGRRIRRAVARPARGPQR